VFPTIHPMTSLGRILDPPTSARLAVATALTVGMVLRGGRPKNSFSIDRTIQAEGVESLVINLASVATSRCNRPRGTCTHGRHTAMSHIFADGKQPLLVG